MNDGPRMHHENLVWPDGLTADTFLQEYWQNRALWMPQALPNFVTPLSPDELAGLALEEDIASRLLVEQDNGDLALEHGPFAAERFSEIHGTRFSLLVPDVDKHLPPLANTLKPFDFIPSWRMDDLMVSYAPDGGSVGAHVDAYDVFLLQASGSREWLIDTRPVSNTATRPTSDAGQLAEFTPNDSRVLEPGDILYLPPGVPHHGIARGDGCTTWSIGFRAPSSAQLVLALAEQLASRMLANTPLDDVNMQRGQSGQLTPSSVATYKDAWRRAVDLDDSQFTDVLGRILTAHGDPDQSDTGATDLPARVRSAPWTRLAWASDTTEDSTDGNDEVALFANGEPLRCSRALAIALCSRASTDASNWMGKDVEVLVGLFESGVLVDDAVYETDE